jgi:segregation and condensation protein B
MFEIPQLKRIIEAALLASAQPLSLPQISGLFDEFEMPSHDNLARAIEELTADAADRGIELVEVASGFRYQIRQDVHPFVSRLWSERQSRYSRALLETLSLIAYRQPITRAEIEQIRGVAVSTNIVRTLEERDWVRVVGYRDLPGKPALFGTTKQFLDYFNLKSLDELPPLAEIRDIEELDPQLAFDAPRGTMPAHLTVDDESDAQDAADADNESHDVEADAATPAPSEEPPEGSAQEDTPESIA